MKAGQNALRALELDRQRSQNFAASRWRGGPSLARGAEKLRPEYLDDDDSIDSDSYEEEQDCSHRGWKLVRNSQALLQVNKRFGTHTRGGHTDLGSSDRQTFVGNILSSRWLMAKSTRELRSLYGPLFGDNMDRSKLLGVATQVVHQVKVLTASACWNEQMKPMKDELTALHFKHKNLAEKFKKAREGYLREVTAARDQVRYRPDPQDGLSEPDLVYFMEPYQLLTEEEQTFALKVVTEKLKMIFAHNSMSDCDFDVGQFEHMQETMKGRELEDMRAALKRTMEKLNAAEHALADQKRRTSAGVLHPPDEASSVFKERVLAALEVEVDELRAVLEQEEQRGRLARQTVEELKEEKEAIRRHLQEEGQNALVMQGKLNHASAQLSAYDKKNEWLMENKRRLGGLLEASEEENKELKSQIRRISARPVAICPGCGGAVSLDLSPCAGNSLKAQPMDEPEPESQQSVRFRGDRPVQHANGKASTPRAVVAPQNPQKPASGGPRSRALRFRAVPADGNAGGAADAGADLADTSTGIAIMGARTGTARLSTQECVDDDEQPVALAAPSEWLMTSHAFNQQQHKIQELSAEREEARRQVEDLTTQRGSLKKLLLRHVRTLTRMETCRLLDDSEDLLKQADALGCRQDSAQAGHVAPSSKEAPEAAEGGDAGSEEAPGAKLAEASSSSTEALATKLRELQDALDEAFSNLQRELKTEGEDSQERPESAQEDVAARARRMMEAQREVVRLKNEKGAMEAKLVTAQVRDSQAAMATMEDGEDSPRTLRDELDATRQMLAATQRLCEGLTSQVARLTEDNAKMASTIDTVQGTLQKASDAVGESDENAPVLGQELLEQCKDTINEAMNQSVFFPLAEGDVLHTSSERSWHIHHLVEETMQAFQSSSPSCTTSVVLPEATDDDYDGIEGSDALPPDDEGPGAMGPTSSTDDEAHGRLGEGHVEEPEDLRKTLTAGVSPDSPVANVYDDPGQLAEHAFGNEALDAQAEGTQSWAGDPSRLAASASSSRSAASVPGVGSLESPASPAGNGPSAGSSVQPARPTPDDTPASLAGSGPSAGSSGQPARPAPDDTPASLAGSGPSAGSSGQPARSAPDDVHRSPSRTSAPGDSGGRGGGLSPGKPERNPRTRHRAASAAASGSGSAAPDARAGSRSQTTVGSSSEVHRFTSDPPDPAGQPAADKKRSPRPGPTQIAAGGDGAAAGAAVAEARGPQDPAGQPAADKKRSPRPGPTQIAAGGDGAAAGAAVAEARGPQASVALPKVRGRRRSSKTSSSASRHGSPGARPPAASEPAIPEERTASSAGAARTASSAGAAEHRSRCSQERTASKGGAAEHRSSGTQEQTASSAGAVACQDAAVQTEWEPGTTLGEEELLRQLHESRQNGAEAEARCEHFRSLLCQHVEGAVLSHSEDLLEEAEDLSREAEILDDAKVYSSEEPSPPSPRTQVSQPTVPALEKELKETDEQLNQAMTNLQQELEADERAGKVDDDIAKTPHPPCEPDADRLARAAEAQFEVAKLRHLRSVVEAKLFCARASESAGAMAMARQASLEAEKRGSCGCTCGGCSCKPKLEAMRKLLAKTLQLCSESTSKFKSTAEDNFSVSNTLNHVQRMLRKANIAFEDCDVVRTASTNPRLMEALETMQQAEQTSVFYRLYQNNTRSRARRAERMNRMVQEMVSAIHYKSDWPVRQVRIFEVPVHVRGVSPVLHPLHKQKRHWVEEMPHARLEHMAMVPERHDNHSLPTVSMKFDPDQQFLNETKLGKVKSSAAQSRSPAPGDKSLPEKHSTAHRGPSPSPLRLPGQHAGHAGRTSSPPPGRAGVETGRRRSADMDLVRPNAVHKVVFDVADADPSRHHSPSPAPGAMGDLQAPRRRRASLGGRLDLKW